MKVQVPKPRATITDEGSDLRITIPIKRNWFTTLFLAFWLCGWAVGEFSAAHEVFSKSIPVAGNLFLIFWLGGWTVGGCFVIYIWLRSLMGKEIILINSMSMSISQKVGNLGRTKEYDLKEVRNLRIAALSYNPWSSSSSLQFWGMGTGLIAFDYGAQTFRFGTGLAESESQDLIDRIKKRFKITDK